MNENGWVLETDGQESTQPEESSTLGNIGQGLKSLGVRALQSVPNAIALPGQIQQAIQSAGQGNKEYLKKFGLENQMPEALNVLPEISKVASKASEDIGNKFGGEEALKPSNQFSEALQDVASSLPLLALTGPLSAAKLASSFGGALGSNAFKDWGLGAQIGASVLGSKGFGKIAGVLKDSLKNPARINDFKNAQYAKTEELGKNISTPSRSIKDTLEELKHDAKSVKQFSTSDIKEVRADIDKLLHDFPKPTTTAADIYNAKVGVNEFFKKPGLSTPLKKYYGKINSAIKGELEKFAPDHKDFDNAWKSGDQLHSIQNWQPGIHKFLGDKLDNKFSRAVLKTSLGKLSTSLIAGLPIAADEFYAKGSRPVMFLKHLQKTPEGQKVLWNIVADSANSSSAGLSKSLRQLDRAAGKWEIENPETTGSDNNGWQLES